MKTYQDTEEVEIFCSTGVVSTLVLELGISVQRVQVLLTKLQEKYESISITNKGNVKRCQTKSNNKWAYFQIKHCACSVILSSCGA